MNSTLTAGAPSVARFAIDGSPAPRESGRAPSSPLPRSGGGGGEAVGGGVSASPKLTAADATARARTAKTAQDFEASFLSTMLGQMFEGVQTSAPFGGGEGEAAFQSFLTDAFAKSMARHGGVGVSRSVQAELLKMQGLN